MEFRIKFLQEELDEFNEDTPNIEAILSFVSVKNLWASFINLILKPEYDCLFRCLLPIQLYTILQV
jgi:hypothetical protein